MKRQLGDPTLSIQKNQKALELSPTLTTAHYYPACISHHLTVGARDKTAMTSLRLLAVLDVGSSTPARAKRLAPRPDGSLTHFASPRGEKCRLGLAYLDLQQVAEALQELRVAANSEGANADVHLAVGSLYLEQNILDQAIQSFHKAVNLDPLRPEGHLGLARAYRRNGWLHRAQAELRLAL